MQDLSFIKKEIKTINILIKQTNEDLALGGSLQTEIYEAEEDLNLLKKDFKNFKKGDRRAFADANITSDTIEKWIKDDEENLNQKKEERDFLNTFLTTLKANKLNLIKEYIKISNNDDANVDNDFIF